MATYLTKGSCGVAEYSGMSISDPEKLFTGYVKDTARGLEYGGAKYRGHAFCVFSQRVTSTQPLLETNIDRLKKYIEDNKFGKCYLTEPNKNRAHGNSDMVAMLFAPDWDKITKWADKMGLLKLSLIGPA